MEIIPFMIVVSFIMIPILLVYCLLVNGSDETLKMFSMILKNNFINLITSLKQRNFINYLYKTNNISKAEPLVIALTLINCSMVVYFLKKTN